MADQITIREINCETGEVSDRPATAEEIAQLEADRLEAEETEAARIAARDRLIEILAKGGLTYEQAALLGL